MRLNIASIPADAIVAAAVTAAHMKSAAVTPSPTRRRADVVGRSSEQAYPPSDESLYNPMRAQPAHGGPTQRAPRRWLAGPFTSDIIGFNFHDGRVSLCGLACAGQRCLSALLRFDSTAQHCRQPMSPLLSELVVRSYRGFINSINVPTCDRDVDSRRHSRPRVRGRVSSA